jgi:hypothetical protein
MRRHKGSDPRTLVTAIGPVTVQRIYFSCLSCRLGEYPLDEPLGFGDTLSPGARRMACLASTLASSFERGHELLSGLAGWSVSDETLRHLCYREGERMKAWRCPPRAQAPHHALENTAPVPTADADTLPPVSRASAGAAALTPEGAVSGPAAAVAEQTVARQDAVEPVLGSSTDAGAVEPVLGSSTDAGSEVVAELSTHFPALAENLAKANAAEAARLSPSVTPLPSSEPAAATPEAEAFRKAKGDIEFEIDAGKVNTTEGWRDMKIGLFAKREHGEPCPPEDWKKRELPRPTVRVAFTAIDTSEHFGPECRAWAARLGIRETCKISVIADGAEWIWALILASLCGARQLLDIFHAAENVAKASKALYGTGTPEAEAWQERVMLALLTQGWHGLCREVGEVLAVRRDEATQAALDSLLGYFAPRLHLLDYPARLQHGEAIGSGMVEGCVKTMINKRLKANGARWQVKNVVRMAELCSLHYSDSWAEYWTAA